MKGTFKLEQLGNSGSSNGALTAASDVVVLFCFTAEPAEDVIGGEDAGLRLT